MLHVSQVFSVGQEKNNKRRVSGGRVEEEEEEQEGGGGGRKKKDGVWADGVAKMKHLHGAGDDRAKLM